MNCPTAVALLHGSILAGVISDRLQAYVRRRFAPDEVEPIFGLLAEVVYEEPGSTEEGIERIQAAVVLIADGDVQRLLRAMEMAQDDWRDVLVAAGLAHEGWPERLGVALGDR